MLVKSGYRSKTIYLGIIVVLLIVVVSQLARSERRVVPPINNITQTPTQAVFPVTKQMTVQGEMVCLPHRNTNGPQTMECAYGLKATDGKYYGLRDSDPTYKNISSTAMGKKVEIIGTFTPKEDKIYPTEGTIEILSIQAL